MSETETERQRQTETDRDRQRQRQTVRETERQRDRETETDRQTDRQTERSNSEKNVTPHIRETMTYLHSHITTNQTHTSHTHTHTHTHTHIHLCHTQAHTHTHRTSYTNIPNITNIILTHTCFLRHLIGHARFDPAQHLGVESSLAGQALSRLESQQQGEETEKSSAMLLLLRHVMVEERTRKTKKMRGKAERFEVFTYFISTVSGSCFSINNLVELKRF